MFSENITFNGNSRDANHSTNFTSVPASYLGRDCMNRAENIFSSIFTAICRK